MEKYKYSVTCHDNKSDKICIIGITKNYKKAIELLEQTKKDYQNEYNKNLISLTRT